MSGWVGGWEVVCLLKFIVYLVLYMPRILIVFNLSFAPDYVGWIFARGNKKKHGFSQR